MGPAATRQEDRRVESISRTVISGLHAAFLLFHNRAVDLVRAERPAWSSDEVFEEARRVTTWHYQWLLLHEFLPRIIGPRLLDEILSQGARFYRPALGEGYIPTEFQIAYRFGHSMVRPSYRANFTGHEGQRGIVPVNSRSSTSSRSPASANDAEPADSDEGTAGRK